MVTAGLGGAAVKVMLANEEEAPADWHVASLPQDCAATAHAVISTGRQLCVVCMAYT